MYYCCTRSEGLIYQGRGKNRHEISFRGLDESIKFAKEYSIKYQKACEVYEMNTALSSIFDKAKARKVAAYKKGTIIYLNR